MSYSKPTFQLVRERKWDVVPQFDQPNRGSDLGHSASLDLIIKGQGVLLFKVSREHSLDSFIDLVFKSGESIETLSLRLYPEKIVLMREGATLADQPTHMWLSEERAFYWVSLDAQNQFIRFGIGEARLETEVFSYFFPHQDKPFLEGLSDLTYQSDQLVLLRQLRDPIISRVPLVVKDTQELTMDDVASQVVLPNAHLAPMAQRLYDTISGKRFELDTPDFPAFPQAIEHSIATPGAWCYEKLKEKAGEFGDQNPKKVYLRITLGQNGGESPGIPFVMEIWPAGCFSPVHNHAGAHAVIRVLHGEIKVKLFPFLGADKPFGEQVFRPGDITWISPTLNQFHQLVNPNEAGPTCITIQCYMYDESDTGHYDYFDYLDDHNQINQYEPDSDMDFLAFKAQMKKEWQSRS